MPMPTPRALWPSIFALLLLPALGCSDGRPERVPVSGQVLLDGRPLTYGVVRFVPEGARASMGRLDANGRFTLTCFDDEDGAVRGVHRVEILSGEPAAGDRMHWHAPARYAGIESSGIEITIDRAVDDLTIHLTAATGADRTSARPR